MLIELYPMVFMRIYHYRIIFCMSNLLCLATCTFNNMCEYMKVNIYVLPYEHLINIISLK